MSPRALLYFYRRRLRVHALQELLAGLGVMIAVALAVGVLLANSSIAGSAGELVHALVGPASLQLRARAPDGFDERILERVQGLPGVTQTAPLLEVPASITGPHGARVTVGLAGARPSLALMDGLGHTLPLTTLTPGELGLTQAGAEQVGVSAHHGSRETVVSVDVRGRAVPLRVAAVLGSGDVGAALAGARLGIMPLSGLQSLAGLPGRITRVLVEVAPGHETQVRAELGAIAAGDLEVAAGDQDIGLLDLALGPSDQATSFFAVMAVLLGFLIALNAMLLTVPERRRAIVELRLLGADRAGAWRMVVFQSLCLGLGASLVGVGVGYVLSVGVLHLSTEYLAPGFTLSGHTVVGVGPLLLAFLCGVLATLLAAVVPLLGVLRRARALEPGSAEGSSTSSAGDALGGRMQLRLALGAILALALTTVGNALFPGVALLVGGGLALTCVLAVPVLFGLLLRLAYLVLDRFQRLGTLALALCGLRSVTLRSLALAATGAVALFGGVALGGASNDTLHGVDGFAHQYVGGAALWVDDPGDYQAVADFRSAGYIQRIASVRGVSGVRTFQGSFVTLGQRRLWITVRASGASSGILATQLVTGTPSTVAARLNAGGWIVLSQQLASERHLTPGDSLALPTPTGPHAYRIAALSTNFGWPPGVVMMSPADYDRDWQSSAPTALGVTLAPGVSPATARDAIARVLGPGSGLEVQTALEREVEIDTSVSAALSRLRYISTLMLLGAILALAAALASSIYQRRPLLSALRLAGATPGRLTVMMLIETMLTLVAGCLTGLFAGVYGEIIFDNYLRHISGLPVASVTANLRPLQLFGLVIAAVLVIVLIPGRRAARVPPTLALQER